MQTLRATSEGGGLRGLPPQARPHLRVKAGAMGVRPSPQPFVVLLAPPHPSAHAAAQFRTAGVVRAAKLGGGPRTGGRSSGARCRARAVGAAKYAKYGNTRSHFNVPMPATRLRGAGRRKALQIGFGLCGGGGRTGPPLCGGDATSDPERGRATMLPCRKIFGRTTARTATDGAEDGGYDLKPVASIARGSWSGARDGG